jgi:hypothetical protein
VRSPWSALALGPLLVAGCGKVPIIDVGARFVLADASWFAEESTLFIFTEVEAEQGLGDPSVLEITYRTDDAFVDWTPLDELVPVHTHVPVDCGPKALCASASVRVPQEPREVGLRLRYHRDGELALRARTVFNVVGRGPDHSNRSLVVYGVFDETNGRVQWRSRHQFPTVRNERATALGLRRRVDIADARYGDALVAGDDNPYGYAVDCPADRPLTGVPGLTTTDRGAFEVEELPLEASDAPTVCATSTVIDGDGVYDAGAWARKNPEVREAFPVLRSPIRDAAVLPFFLGPCERTISVEHEAMQRQRLLIGDLPTTCTDDWTSPSFVPSLIVAFRDAVEAARPQGRDMVLVVGLHQDEPGLSEAVEAALAEVVPRERHRTTPRLAGAFVLDSDIRGLATDALAPVTLWCPATIPLDDIPDVSARSCAVAPDNPDFDLGPFTFGTLPILPSREQYLDFIETYSVRQAGAVLSRSFLTPEFAASAEHVDLGEFGVVTFLNQEQISAGRDDAFSFCVPEEPLPFVFSSSTLEGLTPRQCQALGLTPEDCASITAGLLPIELLPEWHQLAGESNYDLGIFWEFPFLMRMDVEVFAAGAVSALGFSVPFGVADTTESFYGAAIWTADELPLGPNLLQCTRFCEHPTFDSAGVYHPTDAFDPTYATTCYLPTYPVDTAFPFDP